MHISNLQTNENQEKYNVVTCRHGQVCDVIRTQNSTILLKASLESETCANIVPSILLTLSARAVDLSARAVLFS